MADVETLERVLAEKQKDKDEFLAAYRAEVKPLVDELDLARASAAAAGKVAGLSAAEKQALRDALDEDGA